MSAFDDQLQVAAQQALAFNTFQDMVLGWLRTACAHLGESGLQSTEPKTTSVIDGNGANAMCAASCRLELPASDYQLRLEIVLQVSDVIASFGSSSAVLEVFGPELNDAGDVCGFQSLVKHELFSTPRFDPPVLPGRSDHELQELVAVRIQDAMNEAFRAGVGPSLHRFRMALDDKLAP